jgi:hypothetical protein
MNYGDPRLPTRFWNKVQPCPMSGCWLWVATETRGGYGNFRFDGKMQSAHRVSYRLLVGPIATNMEIDHLCRVRCCVNPVHLECVTHAINVQRSTLPSISGARMSSKTECPRGHPYAGSNLYINPTNGHRSCRECVRESRRKKNDYASANQG